MLNYLVILQDAKDPSEEGRAELKAKLASVVMFSHVELDAAFRALPAVLRKEKDRAYADKLAMIVERLGGVVQVLEEQPRRRESSEIELLLDDQPPSPAAPPKAAHPPAALPPEELELALEPEPSSRPLSPQKPSEPAAPLLDLSAPLPDDQTLTPASDIGEEIEEVLGERDGDGYEPPVRRRTFREAFSLGTILFVAVGCTAILSFLFLGPSSEEKQNKEVTPEMIANLLDEQHKYLGTETPTALPTVEPLAALTVHYQGELKVERALTNVDFGFGDGFFYLLRFEAVLDPPPKLSPQDIVAGKKPAPRLKRLLYERGERGLLRREGQRASPRVLLEADAFAYVEDEFGPGRSRVRLKIDGGLDPEAKTFSGTWVVSTISAAAASQENFVRRTGKDTFELNYTGSFSAVRQQELALPTPIPTRTPRRDDEEIN